MPAITNWIVEEGMKFAPSGNNQVANERCQDTASSQGSTQEEPVYNRRKLSSYLRAEQSESEDDSTPESYCKAET